MNGWRHFIYVVASAQSFSALDVQVPSWAMPQIVIVTRRLWIDVSAADAVLLRMAVWGFGVDEGDGTFAFDIWGRFKLDEFAGANYPSLRYRWIELCAVEVSSEKAEPALNAAFGSRLLDRWPACDDLSVGRQWRPSADHCCAR